MPLNPDQNPLFRKVILPWYDTDIACVLTGMLMLAVFAFSVIGVSVAFETPGYSGYLWIPCALLLLSALVVTITILRLYRRNAHRFKKELP